MNPFALCLCTYFNRKALTTLYGEGFDDTVNVATNNFSDANKLGEGGVGSVYKVSVIYISNMIEVFNCSGFLEKIPLLFNYYLLFLIVPNVGISFRACSTKDMT